MSEPVRILNLFTIMNRGGAETMVMNYYRAMDKSKVQFDFMVHRQERGAFDDEIEAMGGRIYRMCPIYPQNIFKYKRLLKDFFDHHSEYQILHSHMSELGYFAFKEAVRHNVPVRICHAHNIPVFANETFTEKCKRIPREILARLIRPVTTDFFACSLGAGEWLFGKAKRKDIVVMNNAIDTEKYVYNQKLSEQLKEQYHWTNKFIIGHVGRFCPQKNHSFLVDIFYSLQKEIPNSILVLVGDGELKSDVEKKVRQLNLQKKVYFMGSRSDVELFYQVFDVFLFPSLYEGFGNVLLEAQACGIQSFTSKDTVPQKACVSSLLHYISLAKSAEEWKDKIIELKDYERLNMYQTIVNSGFDIYKNAQWLTSYYLNRMK